MSALQKETFLSAFGVNGREYLKETLTSSTDPIKAIKDFQFENGIAMASLQSALPFLDLHNIPRLEFHDALKSYLLNMLVSYIKNLIIKLNQPVVTSNDESLPNKEIKTVIKQPSSSVIIVRKKMTFVGGKMKFINVKQRIMNSHFSKSNSDTSTIEPLHQKIKNVHHHQQDKENHSEKVNCDLRTIKILEDLLEKSFMALTVPGLNQIPLLILEGIPKLSKKFVKRLITVLPSSLTPLNLSNGGSSSFSSKFNAVGTDKIKLKISKMGGKNKRNQKLKSQIIENSVTTATLSSKKGLPSNKIGTAFHPDDDTFAGGTGTATIRDPVVFNDPSARVLYRYLTVPAKRHVWVEFYDLFRREVKTFAKAYIEGRKMCLGLLDLNLSATTRPTTATTVPFSISEAPHHTLLMSSATQSLSTSWFSYYALLPKERRLYDHRLKAIFEALIPINTADDSLTTIETLIQQPGGVNIPQGGSAPTSSISCCSNTPVYLYPSFLKYCLDSYLKQQGLFTDLYATLFHEFFMYLRELGAKIFATTSSPSPNDEQQFSTSPLLLDYVIPCSNILEILRKFFWIFELFIKDRADVTAVGAAAVNNTSFEKLASPQVGTTSYYKLYAMNDSTITPLVSSSSKKFTTTTGNVPSFTTVLTSTKTAPNKLLLSSLPSSCPSNNMNIIINSPFKSFLERLNELWLLFTSLSVKGVKKKLLNLKSTHHSLTLAPELGSVSDNVMGDDHALKEAEKPNLKIRLKLNKKRKPMVKKKESAIQKDENKNETRDSGDDDNDVDTLRGEQLNSKSSNESSPLKRSFRIAKIQPQQATSKKIANGHLKGEGNISPNKIITSTPVVTNNTTKNSRDIIMYKFEHVVYEHLVFVLADPFIIDFLSTISVNLIVQSLNNPLNVTLPRDNTQLLTCLSFLQMGLGAKQTIRKLRQERLANGAVAERNRKKFGTHTFYHHVTPIETGDEKAPGTSALLSSGIVTQYIPALMEFITDEKAKRLSHKLKEIPNLPNADEEDEPTSNNSKTVKLSNKKLTPAESIIYHYVVHQETVMARKLLQYYLIYYISSLTSKFSNNLMKCSSLAAADTNANLMDHNTNIPLPKLLTVQASNVDYFIRMCEDAIESKFFNVLAGFLNMSTNAASPSDELLFHHTFALLYTELGLILMSIFLSTVSTQNKSTSSNSSSFTNATTNKSSSLSSKYSIHSSRNSSASTSNKTQIYQRLNYLVQELIIKIFDTMILPSIKQEHVMLNVIKCYLNLFIYPNISVTICEAAHHIAEILKSQIHNHETVVKEFYWNTVGQALILNGT